MGIIFCLSSQSIIIANSNNVGEENCYGFIIELPSGENTEYETFLNSRTRQLVNDILREDCTVYWANEDFNSLSDALDKKDIKLRSFSKGEFIVPFSGNLTTDAKITSIINDYNKTSEINQSDLRIEAYKLLEPISVDSLILSEVKIAQHFGVPTRYGWPCYLLISEEGGFFSYEFLEDDEPTKILNNEDFNVFMWPYNPSIGRVTELFYSLTNYDDLNAVRTFVSNGGGYIGSCYGAEVASAGFLRPFTIFSIRHALNPNLNLRFPLASSALLDAIVVDRLHLVHDDIYIATTRLIDTSHPLSFGVNEYFNDFFNGPRFVWIGDNTNYVGEITDLKGPDDDIISSYFMRSIGTPNFIYSKFGDGNVVVFNSHPEMVMNIPPLMSNFNWEGDRYHGRRVIHNALYYTTSKQSISETENNHPLSLVEDFIFKTEEIQIETQSSGEFSNIISRVERLNNNISNIENKILETLNIYFSSVKNEAMMSRGIRTISYIYFTSTFYNDYLNKIVLKLEKIQKILPLIKDGNIDQEIDLLKEDLCNKLIEAELLVKNTQISSFKMDEYVKNTRLTFPRQLKIIQDSRDILKEYELGLKYIPQMYFESIKFLRHNWYEYEAQIAIN